MSKIDWTIKILMFILAIIFIVANSYYMFRTTANKNEEVYLKGYTDACEDFYNGKLKYDFKEVDGKRIWYKK